jgi:glycosyltransferase involved in cell wall biosynthesis
VNTVLILSNNLFGLFSFRKEVVKAICDAGYKVFISVPEEDAKASYFRGLGCEVMIKAFNRRGMNPFADLKLMMSYKRLIKHLNPLVVLTYTIKPNVYGGIAARLCHVPQLANVTGLGDALENGGWLQKLTVLLYKIGLNKAKKVFFQNKSNLAFCIKMGIARDNAILLPGSGVNLNYHIYQDYPVDEGKNRFLFIGRILKDKGIEELFYTAKAIKMTYPQTEFQIVGTVEGDYQKQLEVLINDGIINYLGPQPDVRPYIGAVECTIMPSYHEGMSNVNLESAANGRPVITTNVPGCKETIEDGKTGFLVEARNANSLKDAVERFIQLPYDKKVIMGQEARKKIEHEFDRQIVIDAYLNEIKVIINV